MIYEQIEDILTEPDADPDKVDRILHIDRAIASHSDAIDEVHQRLDGVVDSIDRNTEQVSALIRERDMLRARLSGAKWVVVTLGLGTVYFFRDILEFLGLIRENR